MVELEVKEMTCGHCVSSVTRAVKSLDPRAEVQVDLDQGRVRVESGDSPARLIEALGEAGYPAAVATAPTPSAGSRKGSCCGCGA